MLPARRPPARRSQARWRAQGVAPGRFGKGNFQTGDRLGPASETQIGQAGALQASAWWGRQCAAGLHRPPCLAFSQDVVPRRAGACSRRCPADWMIQPAGPRSRAAATMCAQQVALASVLLLALVAPGGSNVDMTLPAAPHATIYFRGLNVPPVGREERSAAHLIRRAALGDLRPSDSARSIHALPQHLWRARLSFSAGPPLALLGADRPAALAALAAAAERTVPPPPHSRPHSPPRRAPRGAEAPTPPPPPFVRSSPRHASAQRGASAAPRSLGSAAPRSSRRSRSARTSASRPRCR